MSANKANREFGFLNGGGSSGDSGVYYYKYVFPEELSLEVDAMLAQFSKDHPESMNVFDLENFYSAFHSAATAFYQIGALHKFTTPLILKFGAVTMAKRRRSPFIQVMCLSPIVGFSMTHLAGDPNIDASVLESTGDLYKSYVEIITRMSESNKSEGN